MRGIGARGGLQMLRMLHEVKTSDGRYVASARLFALKPNHIYNHCTRSKAMRLHGVIPHFRF